MCLHSYTRHLFILCVRTVQPAPDNLPCPVGVYPSTLSLLLRHLLLAHQNYRLFTTCDYSPKPATQDTAALPDQLIHIKIGKDPPPLPCENPRGGSAGEWLLAVEDAQARVTVRVSEFSCTHAASMCTRPHVPPCSLSGLSSVTDLHPAYAA